MTNLIYRALACGVLLLSATLSRSQPPTITTLAGSPGQGSANGTGAAARFANPWGVASDASGNLYIADTDNHIIRKVTNTGVVTTLAGMAGVSGSADGSASNARFYAPQGVAVDDGGIVYVADTGNQTVRKITAAGVVSTLAGSPGASGSANGSRGNARFYQPEGIAVDSSANLYVADTWNHTIRKITSGGSVSTLAGSPGTYGTTDGTGANARFYQPQALAVDGAGNVYVADTGNQTIRKITSAGSVSTLAGSAGNYGSGDGNGTSAFFYGPTGIALDSATNVYVADSLNDTIRKVTPAGGVSTLAGTAGSFGSADGSGGAAQFREPQGVAVDGAGNVYVADTANGTIRKIASGAVVTTVAGSASTGSADGAGSNARFYWPAGAAVDGSGNIYVADTENSTIRKITPTGTVTTLAGSTGAFGTNDATGSSARFYGPQGIAAGGSGNLYVADTANHTIRKITSAGAVSTLAGSGGTNGLVDGTGSDARFNSPQDVAVDSSGTVYVADTWNHTIRKVTSGGVVTTLAGLPGYPGNIDSTSAGNGTNTARFYCPSGIAVDTAGNVYVADTCNHTIRKVTSAGVVSTLAGMPGVWGSDDGTNSGARFFQPQGVTVDSSGNLYVLDSGNQTVRLITPSGNNWVVTTVAGLPNVSGSADGTGNDARFLYPSGIGINSVGTFYVADLGNNTVRASSSSAAPQIVGQPQDLTVNQGQDAAFSVNASGSTPLAYQWLLYGTNLAGATTAGYTAANAQPGDAGPYSVIITNNYGSITSSTAMLTVIQPPGITGQPHDLTVNQNASAGFTVTASGTAPLAYQWLFGGGNISTATASSYTLPSAQPTDAGTYTVIVSNDAGSVTSDPAILTVNPIPTPPQITGQPQDLTVSQGSNATFAVSVNGSIPFAYQWRFYGTNLASATGSSYTRASAQAVNAGPYSVVITNDYGAKTSSTAMLTVILPPIISIQPAGQLASVSNNVTFTVGLSQATSPAYQWRKNGTSISSGTLSSLTLNSILWADAGTYSVIVSNSAGSQVSADAALIVQQAAFTFFDGFESYNLGILDNNFGGPNTASTNPWWALTSNTQGSVTDSSSGVAPHSGAKMAGRTGTSFLQDYINLPYRMNAGQPYYGNFLCEWWFYDPYGTGAGSTSYADYMALCQYAPVSTTGDSSSFSTYAQRMSLGTYNSSGYNVAYYQARIIGGSGQFGSGNSWYNTATPRSVGWHHARIVVGIPDSSTLAPVSMYIDDMTNATVTSSTTGVSGGFNLIELNHANSSSGYYDDLTFRAANDPWIVEQPVSQSVLRGQGASFTTVAVGTAYQWQFNGNNIATATGSAYNIPSVANTNAGNYACVISGTNGTVTTSIASLTVNGPPMITAQPTNQTVLTGNCATFSVTATGTGSLFYQWQWNGTTRAMGTDLNSYLGCDAGSYSCIVSNTYGAVTSQVAVLTIDQPPVATNLTADTYRNQPWSITVPSLLSHASDPDGDQLSLSTFTGTSTNGGLVALNAGTITYTPALNIIGADRFTYTVSDTYGATASAYVLVSVNADSALIPSMLAPANVDGGIRITFNGATGCTYSVQRALSLPASWTTIGSATVNPIGVGTFLDANAPTNSAFYRATYP